MKPYEITEDHSNRDIFVGMDRSDARQYYREMWGSFESRFGTPIVEEYEGKYVLRADLAPGGLKAFGGERVIAESPYDTMVYVAPRQGHAPDAIAAIAKEYGKKCVFFMPASNTVSDHQAAVFAYDNVEVRFFRAAAMPMLNSYAKRWASENNAQFITFGLSNLPIVTAGLVNMCNTVSESLGKDPTEIYCAVSTGTMIRALQIGWPEADPYGVAVARNIKRGEKGVAVLESATIPFLKRTPAADRMPFPSTGAYDAKAWDIFVERGAPGSIFINVGSDAQILRNLKNVDVPSINSMREWRDLGDWQENRSLNEGYTTHWVENNESSDNGNIQQDTTKA